MTITFIKAEKEGHENANLKRHAEGKVANRGSPYLKRHAKVPSKTKDVVATLAAQPNHSQFLTSFQDPPISFLPILFQIVLP